MGLFDFFKQEDINQGIEEYGSTAGAILLDVRIPQEYQEGHIPESKNIPLQQLNNIVSVVKNKDIPLFVYCYSGVRSRQATGMLQHMEYMKVKNKDRIKRQNKKTIRSEMVNMLVWTSIMTMLLVGGGLSVIIFQWSSIALREDMDFYMESVEKQFTNHLLFWERSVIYLSENENMNYFFRTGSTEGIEKVMKQGINLFSNQNMVSDTFPIVSDYYVFSKNMEYKGIHFYPETQSADNIKNTRIIDGIKRYRDQDKMFYYRKNGQEIECYFSVYDDDMERMGYCVAIFDMENINKIFSKLEKYQTYYWSIQTNDGTEIGGTGLNGILKDELINLDGEIKKDHKKYLYKKNQDSFGLSTYIIIPKSKLYLDIRPGFQLAWTIAVSMFIAVVVSALYYSRRVTYPLQRIVKKIEQVGTGDFETKLENYNILEFQQISNSFNEMTVRIETLIKEVYETQLLVKEARLQYLQAQINPHFMFNVLTMIAIKVKKHRDEELYQTVTSFAGLMRGKLFRRNEVEIKLKEEMEIAGFYLYLQSERFKDIITYNIEWESDEIKECYVPRLCIEPIVENAVIHGLEPKGTEGRIRVAIREASEDSINIVVEDDGVGFNVNEMDDRKDNKNPRVGVMNIQRLIRNLYGDKYGVLFQSEIGKGTIVTVCLPMRKDRTV